jgi:hypothetical protein
MEGPLPQGPIAQQYSVSIVSTKDVFYHQKRFSVLPRNQLKPDQAARLQALARSMVALRVNKLTVAFFVEGEESSSVRDNVAYLKHKVEKKTDLVLLDFVLDGVVFEKSDTPPPTVVSDEVRNLFLLFVESLDYKYDSFALNPRKFADRSFGNGAYKHYKAQLEAKVNALIEKYPKLKETTENWEIYFEICKTFITHIKEDKSEDIKGYREFHKKFVETFRTLHRSLENKIGVSSKPHTLAACEFVRDLTLWYYEEVKVWPFWQEELVREYPEAAKNNPKEIMDFFMKAQEAFVKNTNIGIPCRFLSTADPISCGDHPSVLWKYKDKTEEGSKIPVMRFPNVVIMSPIEGSLVYKCEVDPIFEGYLRITQRPDKSSRHLYVNLTSRVKENGISTLIEGLDVFMGDTIDVVSFDVNSDFFWQPQQFEHLSESQKFKNAFLEHMLREDNCAAEGPKIISEDTVAPYYWSKKIDREWLKTECKKIIDLTHFCYADSSPRLEIFRRLGSQIIFICQMIKSLVKHLKSRSFNISCLSSIDRAELMQLCLKFYHDGGNDSKEFNIKRLLKYMTLFFGPGVIYLNRLPHTERFEVFKAFVDMMIEPEDVPTLEPIPSEKDPKDVMG